jgi:DNA-binding response OmpR family regulator
MSNVTTPASSSIPKLVSKKIVARVLLADLEDSISTILRDCFKQFGIQTLSGNGDAERRLHKEKFEACVVNLGSPDAERVLSAARTSPSNSRIVIYAISRDTQQSLRYSKYGINAVMDSPVERATVLKVVRSTHLLVVHELRRYVRLPVVTEVRVEYGANASFRATSVEISAGGMSMKTDLRLPKEQAVEVTFSLPNNGNMLSVRATVCWRRDAVDMLGIRFDGNDERRLAVKRWIDSFLEIG